MNIIPTNNLK